MNALRGRHLVGIAAGWIWAVVFLGAVGLARAADPADEADARPARVSLVERSVSFWRTGADDWVRARLNTPLAPGDHLYASADGRFEVQFGPDAFARANYDTELELQTLEPGYVQFRVTRGVVSIDWRTQDPGLVVEVDAPGAAFTIAQPGVYRVDVGEETTVFVARQGGEAEAVVEDGERWRVRSDEQVVVDPSSSPAIHTYRAAELDDWDRWNADRTADVIAAGSTEALPRGVYGADELARHGSWVDESSYGRVWYPRTVAVDWAPYSTGNWVADPYFGWTWIDDSPWGWAPFHYGRWVRVGPRWGWAPGPIVARPFYAPAVVGFLAGPRIALGGPIGWVALGWGEPILPWWGYRGFIGAPCWRGWGGPRVINNVVIHNRTVIRVDRIRYSHTRTDGALISVPRDRFGSAHVRDARLSLNRNAFRSVHGALPVRPTSRNLVPVSKPEDRHVAVPSRRALSRSTVATRRPVDATRRLDEGRIRPAQRRERAGEVVVPNGLSRTVQEARDPGAASPARERPRHPVAAAERLLRPGGEDVGSAGSGHGRGLERSARPQAVPPLPRGSTESGRSRALEPRSPRPLRQDGSNAPQPSVERGNVVPRVQPPVSRDRVGRPQVPRERGVSDGAAPRGVPARSPMDGPTAPRSAEPQSRRSQPPNERRSTAVNRMQRLERVARPQTGEPRLSRLSAPAREPRAVVRTQEIAPRVAPGASELRRAEGPMNTVRSVPMERMPRPRSVELDRGGGRGGSGGMSSREPGSRRSRSER